MLTKPENLLIIKIHHTI